MVKGNIYCFHENDKLLLCNGIYSDKILEQQLPLELQTILINILADMHSMQEYIIKQT